MVIRLPFEESSVWLDGSVREAPRPTVDVTLSAGDVLCVPFQWWHAVHCVSESLTLNQWFSHPFDHRARLEEACARAVGSALLRPLAPPEAWLNTHYDEMQDPEDDISLLVSALAGTDGESSSTLPSEGKVLRTAKWLPTRNIYSQGS